MRKSLLVGLTAAAAILLTASPVLAVTPEGESVTSAASKARRAADWRQFRGGAEHRGVNAYETELSTTSVGGVDLQFVTGQGFNSSPAVANGVMYIANGGLHAYPADCATDGSVCSELWTGNSGFANWSSPAVGGGAVYVSGANGLSAYRVGCRNDGGECAHMWRDAGAAAHFTSPTFSAGVVYSVTDAGWLNAYDARVCNDAGGSCLPTWTADLGGLVQSSPAVADGIVYVGTADGHLHAYRADCATGGAKCDPIWTADLNGFTVSSPAVGGGVVYMATHGGDLFAFPTSCRTTGPECDPLWTAVLPRIIHTSVAVTDTAVYVGANKRLYAFAVGCASDGQRCDPLWKSTRVVGGVGELASSPAVANGVVYIGTQARSQSNGRLVAFPAECGVGGATCHRLWRSPLLDGIVNSSPAVAHGMVFVSSNSGQTFAFGLN